MDEARPRGVGADDADRLLDLEGRVRDREVVRVDGDGRPGARGPDGRRLDEPALAGPGRPLLLAAGADELEPHRARRVDTRDEALADPDGVRGLRAPGDLAAPPAVERERGSRREDERAALDVARCESRGRVELEAAREGLALRPLRLGGDRRARGVLARLDDEDAAGAPARDERPGRGDERRRR